MVRPGAPKISPALVGLLAKRADGSVYGKIVALYNFGANDIIEIEKQNGKLEMLPAEEPYLGRVYIEDGYVTIMPPEYVEATPE